MTDMDDDDFMDDDFGDSGRVEDPVLILAVSLLFRVMVLNSIFEKIEAFIERYGDDLHGGCQPNLKNHALSNFVYLKPCFGSSADILYVYLSSTLLQPLCRAIFELEQEFKKIPNRTELDLRSEFLLLTHAMQDRKETLTAFILAMQRKTYPRSSRQMGIARLGPLPGKPPDSTRSWCDTFPKRIQRCV
jgi:hypothetical protein